MVLVRGLERHISADDGPGVAPLIRAREDDLFRLEQLGDEVRGAAPRRRRTTGRYDGSLPMRSAISAPRRSGLASANWSDVRAP